MKEINIKNKKIKYLLSIIFIILFVVLIIIVNKDNPQNNKQEGNTSVKYVNAKVIDILEDNSEIDNDESGIVRGSQNIKIEITEGEHKDETIEVVNYLSSLHNVYVKDQSEIIVRIDTRSNGSYEVSVYNYNRTSILYIFILVFFAALCLIGGKKGAKSLIGLIFTLMCVVFILLPLVLKGYSSLLVSIFIISITTIVCLVLIDGINKKTVSAIIGTISGVVVAGIFAIVVGKLIHVTGFNTEEAESLLLVASDGGLKIKGLLVSGILISSLGAVMDVAMSIASSINELYLVNNRLTHKELFTSGMNIGKDAMGTMANTLILAFTGSSLNLLILIFTYGIPFNQLINTDLVAIEILRGISGSLGIVLTVPIVAYISSYIVTINKIK